VVLAEHTLVTGEVVLRELGRVLRTRIGLPAGAVREVDEFLREYEVAPKPSARAAVPQRDRDDQWVVASAVDSRADVLVTGDRDLLDIGADVPIRIVDPRGFWDLVRKNE
jgi:putative PIN family toxin of toxin-antitoxin system